jgi:hypothetical protein
MAIEYKFRVRSPAGALTNEFVDVRSFSYTREVNAPGMMTLDVDDAHPVLAAVDDSLDNIIEVWRRDRAAGIDWYCDYRGLLRDEMREANADGQVTVRLFWPGPLSLLKRVGVAYRGGVAGRSEFTATPVESIMHAVVKYNATSAGTTGDGRLRNVDLTRVTVEADGAYGTVIDYSCQYRYVLDVLQEICRMAPGDFDLVYTGGGNWQYRFYEGQLGTDRSATVRFALQYGNMASPVYQKNRINERTVAIVLGPGEEATRTVAVRIPSYSNYDVADNSMEFFVDARGASSSDEVNAIGDAAIWEARAESRLSFQVLQTVALRYGRDYFLGDLVQGYFQGISKTLKIYAVTVAMDGSGEEMISVEMRDA